MQEATNVLEALGTPTSLRSEGGANTAFCLRVRDAHCGSSRAKGGN